MKVVYFLGDSVKRLREFPPTVQREAGYQLDKVQRGMAPADFKPMPIIGKGVEEIRIRDARGTYRIIYTARRPEAVYVPHAFQKKTQATAKHDIEIAQKRFAEITGGQK